MENHDVLLFVNDILPERRGGEGGCKRYNEKKMFEKK